ncbi:MAG: cytochrome c [Vicinamibacterales bacterium]
MRTNNRLATITTIAAVSAVLSVAATSATGEQTRPPTSLDASDLADGMRLYQQKANCAACHGWAGDGSKLDNQMPSGANLRESKLPRELVVMTIKCGRPNTQMPAFDKFAYTDGRCSGMTQADLQKLTTRMPDPPSTLQPREVDLLVDFLMTKVVGQGPMDRAKCVAFWGEDADPCRDLH